MGRKRDKKTRAKNLTTGESSSSATPVKTAQSEEALKEAAVLAETAEINVKYEDNKFKRQEKMKNLLNKYPDSPYIYGYLAAYYLEFSDLTSNSTHYLNLAIDSASRGLSVVPNSLGLNTVLLQARHRLARDDLNKLDDVANDCYKVLEETERSKTGDSEATKTYMNLRAQINLTKDLTESEIEEILSDCRDHPSYHREDNHN